MTIVVVLGPRAKVFHLEQVTTQRDDELFHLPVPAGITLCGYRVNERPIRIVHAGLELHAAPRRMRYEEREAIGMGLRICKVCGAAR